MRKKYTEHEREVREKERIQRSKDYERRKQEKLDQESAVWYLNVLIITINILYTILKFLGLFKLIKYISARVLKLIKYLFFEILKLIKYSFLKIVNLIPASINFIFAPLFIRQDTLLIFRLLSIFLRLNLVFFIGVIIFLLTSMLLG